MMHTATLRIQQGADSSGYGEQPFRIEPDLFRAQANLTKAVKLERDGSHRVL